MTAVLLVGATGMLGMQIANALLDKSELQVSALVRPDSHQKLADLAARGLNLVVGDLLDPQSLGAACQDIDVIVSAVSGGQDVALDGQLNLIRAAETQGVKRMIPSDYSVDYRQLDWGDNYNLDMRKRILAELERSSLDYTLVLNGVLTDVLFSPWLKIFDLEAGTFQYWGDGETGFDTTTISDVAKYVAAAVLDPSLANQALEVAGDTLGMRRLYDIYTEVTGNTLRQKCLGSVEDLLAWIERTKAQATSPYAYLPEQYLYTMVSGKGKLARLDGMARYPQIQPQSIRSFLQQQ